LCLPLQPHGNGDVGVGVDMQEGLSRLTRMKYRLVPPIRAVLQLVSMGAVLRETARLPQAATVTSPATTSAPAVMTSQKLAATVRAHLKKTYHSVEVWVCLDVCL